MTRAKDGLPTIAQIEQNISRIVARAESEGSTGSTAARVLTLDEDGWPAFKIAQHLGISLSEVRRALDPHAQAMSELWAHQSVQHRQRRSA